MNAVAMFDVRSVYGNNTVYPANAVAGLLTKLTGKKTVSELDLRVVHALGFEVVLHGCKADVDLIAARMSRVRDSAVQG